VKKLYTVWIRIDETLPWIELKGEYQTRKEARKRAEEFLISAKAKIVEIPEKKRPMKQLAIAKTAH
jgi:hypothetical protein